MFEYASIHITCKLHVILESKVMKHCTDYTLSRYILAIYWYISVTAWYTSTLSPTTYISNHFFRTFGEVSDA
jgi:hypothetical protein